MYYGVQYYPEHWPEDRWSEDVKLMAEAGVNTVRMGEFAWGAYQPSADTCDFSWMDRAIALLFAHGIRTIMCTCSRTPPPWVFASQPELTNVDIHGERQRWGGRYTYCPSSTRFDELARAIDRKVVEHFAGNPGIVGWQIDNEVGGGNDCYCPTCLSTFHDYLRRKYETPEALSESWGRNFWSFGFSAFEEVPLPRPVHPNPQLGLEYRRFLSSLNCAFVETRARMIRDLDPDKWITANFQSFQARHTDYFAQAGHLDYNGMNYYPLRSPEFLLDYYRSTRGRMLVLEQFTRLEPEDSGPGLMRLFAYRAIAHGAAGINYFRWRVSRQGQEMHADGILPQAGQTGRRYEELRRLGSELGRVGKLFDDATPQSRAAVVVAYDSRWAEDSMSIPGVDTAIDAIRIHDSFMARNTSVDATHPRDDLSGYAIVFAPRLFLVDEEITSNLVSYVEAGGVLVLTAGSGVVDAAGRCFDVPRPGPLAEIAGIEVSDLARLRDPVSVRGVSEGFENFVGEGELLADEVHPGSALVAAEFASGWRGGLPALTVNSFGAGRVYYLATTLTPGSFADLVGVLCDLSGIEPVMETPAGVRAHRLVSREREILMLLNYDGDPRRVRLPTGSRNELSGETKGEVVIPGLDVAIVSRALREGLVVAGTG